MNPEELIRLLRQANVAQQQGYTRKEIDAYLLNTVGMTKRALNAAVQALPKAVVEDAASEVTTARLNEQLAYGLTLGWLDEMAGIVGAIKGKGYRQARDAARAEVKAFQKEHPVLANSMRGVGIGAGTLATMGGASSLGALAKGAGVGTAVRSGVGSASLLPGTVPGVLSGAAAGTAAGAGGVFGESEGAGRLPGAATGALAGAVTGGALRPALLRAGAAGAAADASATPSALRRLLPLLGAAGGGAGVKGIFDYLMDR